MMDKVDKALQTMINNMPEKTGKSLEEWKTILKEKAFAKHSEGVKFLKTEYNVSHGFANTIVTLSKKENNSNDDLVGNQYKGKESLFPIYEGLIAYVKTLGDDVTITPKKSSVSIIRKRQFVLIKPATKTRIDLGFKLKDKPTTDRLGNSGPFGSMCTHRVKLSNIDEVDEELKGWIKEAYEKSI
jgi:predicted transport protein